MIIEDLLYQTEEIIQRDGRLIHLPSRGRAVFVGDTHGDLDATERVVEQYLKQSHYVVFLGDYVDRGERSLENLLYLLRMKREHPDRIFLLAGNHEGYMTKEFQPANFWDSLSPNEREVLGLFFSKFPLAATSPNGILAVHGGLPDLNSLDEVTRIDWGDGNWDRILWGDFVEIDFDQLGGWWGRPQFGSRSFYELMERYGKRILVRSHQPNAPLRMFNNRCVTIFTSRAYLTTRTLLIADLETELRTAEDVLIETI